MSICRGSLLLHVWDQPELNLTVTTNVYRSEQFEKTMKAMQTSFCSVDEVIFEPDFQQSLYCHLLCGLIFCDELQVISSTFAHRIIHSFRTFEHYAGGIPLLSVGYGSSEGWIGANVNSTRTPEMATFVVLPNIRYFEFIPLKESNVASQDHAERQSEFVFVEPRPVGLTDVKVGEEYEVVVTNFAGVSSSYDSNGHKRQPDECIEKDARASCAPIKMRGLGDKRQSFNRNGVASTFSRVAATEHVGSTRAESQDEREAFNWFF
nr:jasmonic acid-amido synthetase JAR1-like [Tanacetum cinerariifolium]